MREGYKHLDTSSNSGWQIECYPHPALIEIFGLDRRLAYKKGRVREKKSGQKTFAGYITRLRDSKILGLDIPEGFSQFLEEPRIESLKGSKLKVNEDVLDSIVILYIAGLFASSSPGEVYGSAIDGYIYVPKLKCI